jgi:hypothetical protein
MTLPAETLIAHTLEKMHSRIAESAREGRIQSGLLFTGNIHDAFPRRLLLDTRLSSLDKMAWMMIRLYAQQNEGAIFPTYDELQLQLAAPGKGKASRETVSRVLLMLRLTGWLSLCKRVRDSKGRVRGNIYAQHDEPLTACDADVFDPLWLDVVAEACHNKNQTISMTARNLISEIQNDPAMRHYHSHLAQIASRLDAVQTPRQMAQQVAVMQGSGAEPGENKAELSENSHGSEAEPSHKNVSGVPDSVIEPSVKSGRSGTVREPNHKYVRNITQSVKKNTYVLPDWFAELISHDDQLSLVSQLQRLPDEQASCILTSLSQCNPPRNPTAWMLSMLKKARDGKLKITAERENQTTGQRNTNRTHIPDTASHSESQRPFGTFLAKRKPELASVECVTESVTSIRAMLVKARSQNSANAKYSR